MRIIEKKMRFLYIVRFYYFYSNFERVLSILFNLSIHNPFNVIWILLLFKAKCISKNVGKSIKINGFQQSLIVNFEVEQSFYHNEKCIQEVSYIFPNDFKNLNLFMKEEELKNLI